MTEELSFQGNGSDRLPPQNIEVEEAILGGILLDPEAIGRVSDRLVPEAFYISAHKDIYQAALRLNAQGKPTDLLAITSWLTDHDLLVRVGGRNKLVALVNRTVSAVNIDALAGLVMDKYLRRLLIKTGNEIVQLGYTTETELPKIFDQVEQKVFSVTQERPQLGLVHIADTLINAFQDIETRHQGIALPGVPCGFYDLDAMTSGFQRSDLIIVAGRPSMGKCLSHDAEILLSDGQICTIAELYHQRQGSILTLSDRSQFTWTQPSGFVDDGIKPVFAVTTRSGRSIETTITHPYLTMKGWERLENLQIGTQIAVPRKLDVFGKETIPESEVKLLAYSVSNDGCLLAKNAENKHIPPLVFKLERKQISLFINSLFARDGLIVPFNSSQLNQLRLSYITFSPKIARQVQHLLLRFGVISNLEKSTLTCYLNITEPESLKTFISEIGIFGKESILAELMATLVVEKSQKFLEGDIFWDEIVAIESVGDKQVYDLTIPETHNFLANDICVHNTAFCLNLAHNIASGYKLPVAVFSLEMSKEQLVQRLLASEALIETGYLRSGRISQNQWEPLSRAVGILSDIPIFLDDTANITVTQMRSQVRRLQAEQGTNLGLVIIDYLQLMEGGGDNRVQELSKITRSLKGLARELSVPIIALSQLSRGVEARTNKRPMLSDLRESGSIEQDADLVIMLYRDEYYNSDSPDRGLAEVIVSKHRNGPTGTIKLLFDPQFTKFKNLARQGNY